MRDAYRATKALDIRFHRALHAHKPGWAKWDFNLSDYPLLRQIQDIYSECLERSFVDERIQFYVDFIERETLDACTFPDRDEPSFVFIGLTRRLVDELHSLTTTIATSAEVQTLVGITPSPPAEGLADALFFFALNFVVGHEVGHYVYGHIVDRALHFEYSGTIYQDVDLRRHADELAADAYGIRELCRNVLDGDLDSELMELLPPGGAYGTDQFVALLAISVTAVFLLHLSQPRPEVDLAKDKHPPLAYRQHRIMQIMQHWLARRGESTTSVTGAGHHSLMQAVGNALPTDLRPRWDAQIDVLDSLSGRAYLHALDNLASEETREHEGPSQSDQDRRTA